MEINCMTNIIILKKAPVFRSFFLLNDFYRPIYAEIQTDIFRDLPGL